MDFQQLRLLTTDEDTLLFAHFLSLSLSHLLLFIIILLKVSQESNDWFFFFFFFFLFFRLAYLIEISSSMFSS